MHVKKSQSGKSSFVFVAGVAKFPVKWDDICRLYTHNKLLLHLLEQGDFKHDLHYKIERWVI